MVKVCVLAGLVGLFAVPVSLRAQDGKAEVLAAERRIWDSFGGDHAKAEAVLRELAAPECVLQMFGVTMTREQEISQSGGMSNYGYTMDDAMVQMISPTTAYLTARVKWHGTYEGRALQGDNLTTTLWVKRDGKWIGVLHTQMEAAKLPA